MSWGFTKKPDFQGGGHKKPLYRGKLPKGGLEQFADLGGGGLDKKDGLVFLRRGVDTPMHTMSFYWL